MREAAKGVASGLGQYVEERAGDSKPFLNDVYGLNQSLVSDGFAATRVVIGDTEPRATARWYHSRAADLISALGSLQNYTVFVGAFSLGASC
jgi:hypothetical protein